MKIIRQLLACALMGLAACSPRIAHPRIMVSLARDSDWTSAEMRRGLQAAGDSLGLVLEFRNAGNDTARQHADVIAMIATHPDAIVVMPVDSKAVSPTIAAIMTAKIPLFAMEGGVFAAAKGWSGSNDRFGGGYAMGFAVRKINESGSLAILDDNVTTATRDRIVGMWAVLGRHPAVSLVGRYTVPGSSRDAARRKALGLMAAFGDLEGFLAVNDELALGAADAVRESGKNIFVVGFGGSPQALAAIRSGTSALQATIETRPALVGNTVAHELRDYFNHDQVTLDGTIAVRLLTRDSLPK